MTSRLASDGSRRPAVRVFDADHIEEQSSDLRSESLQARAGKWASTKTAAVQHMGATYSFLDWLAVALPCVTWIRRYKVKKSFLWDLMAGLSIGFMVVPQGMSYALLAGLPPVYGLYTAFIPPLVYALFGSSRHLVVGPVAVTSLLLGDAMRTIIPELSAVAAGTSTLTKTEIADLHTEYNTAVIQITFLVAIIYLVVGILRLGYLANFLSHSVISGFTTGAAVIIGLSQLKYMFGIKVANSHTALQNFQLLIKAVHGTQWRDVVMCLSWLVILLGMKHLGKRYRSLSWMRPLGPITVCVIAIATVKIFDLDGKGLVRTVANVPKGLPGVSIGLWLPLHSAGAQIRTAFVVFIVDLIESVSIAKALARRNYYKISVSQEIAALGVVNLIGGMFGCYTSTGSFSRSAVNADVGARTGLAGFISGLIVMMTLLFLTPIFELIPYNAMGAIVLSAVFGLFELSEMLFLFHAAPLDWLVWMAAFLGTIFLGVEIGLGIAIGLAILLVVYQSAFPHMAVLGQLPDTKVYRNIKQYPLAVQQPNMLVLRVDAPIYFANVEFIRGRVEKYTARLAAQESAAPLHFVILDLSPVSFMDSTGMHAMLEMVTELKEAGIRLVLANPSRKVQEQLLRVHLLEAIGREWVFVNTSDAVMACAAEVPALEAGANTAEFSKAQE